MQIKSLVASSLSLGLVLAQRPASESICDYYTTALLKQNTPTNQFTLLTLLVNTVAIGNYTQPNVGIAVPGILAPGVYNGEKVNLLPYFNGCLKSTNRNNMPSSVNFLDGGGAAPLMKNQLPTAGSNQYFLVLHLYEFFGKLLGCSGYGEMGFPSYGGNPSMYSVHKYMALDHNQVGYFNQQVGLAAASFGVSQADVAAVGSALNMYFNYRCSPPTDIGIGGPQLESICDANSCPLDPKAACGDYPNWGYSHQPQVAPQCAGQYGNADQNAPDAGHEGWSNWSWGNWGWGGKGEKKEE